MTAAQQAFAKVNLVLRVGGAREDGLHPICSIFASVALADRVTVELSEADAVVCPGVAGENLAERALVAFRAAVPRLPPLRVTIEKRVPVAAGLGGGSADAAAVLRAANRLSGDPLDIAELRELGAGLGSDVPSQVDPRHAFVAGVGEQVTPVKLPAMALALVPQAEGLSTAEVYEELDRLRARPDAEPVAALDPPAVRRLDGAPLAELAAAVHNDLEPAVLSLRPDLAGPLADLTRAGALAAGITGSGPTSFGIFPDRAAAEAAADRIQGALVTKAREC